MPTTYLDNIPVDILSAIASQYTIKERDKLVNFVTACNLDPVSEKDIYSYWTRNVSDKYRTDIIKGSIPDSHISYEVWITYLKSGVKPDLPNNSIIWSRILAKSEFIWREDYLNPVIIEYHPDFTEKWYWIPEGIHKLIIQTNDNIYIEKWYKNGECHRDNDEPAYYRYNPDKCVKSYYWIKTGQLHRDNGAPACIYINPSYTEYEWWENDTLIKSEKISHIHT